MTHKIIFIFALTFCIAHAGTAPEELVSPEQQIKDLELRIKALEDQKNALSNQLNNNVTRLALEEIKDSAIDRITQETTAKILTTINVPFLQDQIIYTVSQQISPHVNTTLINSFDTEAVTNKIIKMVSMQVKQEAKNEFEAQAIYKISTDLQESVYQKAVKSLVDNFDTERVKKSIIKEIGQEIMYELRVRFGKDAVQQLTRELKESVHEQAKREIVNSTNTSVLKNELYTNFKEEYVPLLKKEFDYVAFAHSQIAAQRVYGQVLATNHTNSSNECAHKALVLLLNGCGTWDTITQEKLHATPCEIAIAAAEELLKYQPVEKKQ